MFGVAPPALEELGQMRIALGARAAAKPSRLLGLSNPLRQSRRDGNVESAVRKAVYSFAHIELGQLAFGTYDAGPDGWSSRSDRLDFGRVLCIIVLLFA